MKGGIIIHDNNTILGSGHTRESALADALEWADNTERKVTLNDLTEIGHIDSRTDGVWVIGPASSKLMSRIAIEGSVSWGERDGEFVTVEEEV